MASFLLIGGMTLVASGANAGYDASGLRSSWGHICQNVHRPILPRPMDV
ncbi:MAG: hypothetical protein IKB05_02355 [Alphaproteobacteria bacterium]|nr:hypothetical protein [Alphaproteobacteria bacterium]